MAGETRKYRAGFSLKGFVCAFLAMLPNVIWAIIPPANDILAENSVEIPLLDLLMNICRIALIALLVLVLNNKEEKGKKAQGFLLSMAVCLLVYYVSWVMFYKGVANPWVFIIGLATAPSLYFVFLAIWLKNNPALFPAVVFAVAHITIIAIGFL